MLRVARTTVIPCAVEAKQLKRTVYDHYFKQLVAEAYKTVILDRSRGHRAPFSEQLRFGRARNLARGN
jgi:hypothetical protein